MSRRQRYPYPDAVGEKTYIADVSDRAKALLVWSSAHKYAYRRNWVFRTHWDGQAMIIRRAA